MYHIKINSFGPLTNIDLELKGSGTSMVFIGAQATGKSTLAKTLYFFRKVKDLLVEFL